MFIGVNELAVAAHRSLATWLFLISQGRQFALMFTACIDAATDCHLLVNCC